ncbi:MAG: permease-like cell division protein FtsX [Bacteroidales bacterium]|nr:permease-like cell division protein FtsX [Bacteroidales bacterium]
MKKGNSFFNMQALTSCISMTLVLVLLGAVVFFVLTARNLSDQVKENINITLLLSDDTTQGDVTTLQNALTKKEYIKHVSFHSKEEALKELSKDMGTDPSDFLGSNPLTASLELGLKADYANPDSIYWISKELKASPKVIDLIYQKEWVETINQWITKISLVLLILAGLLTFISFALINNTLRLSVYGKRFLIHTMKLVGARWSFIRRPFLLKGMALGLIAAITADALLYAGYMGLIQIEPALQEVVPLENQLIVGGAVLLFGLLITLVCAYFSVNKFLHMKTSAIYTA